VTRLCAEYTKEEMDTISLCSGNEYEIIEEIKENCYILNIYGKMTYQDCFGKIEGDYLRKQRYNPASPKRVIKFYQYYLLEDENSLGDWFVGTKQKNGAIEFLSCCESLQFAFESL